MTFRACFIMPTTDCPIHCEHCFYEIGHTPRVREANFLEPLGVALDDLRHDGLQQLIVSGGEPLACEGTWPLLRLLDRQLLHVLLLTHGELLTEEALGRLEGCGVDDLTIGAPEPTEGVRRAVQLTLFRSRYLPTVLTTFTRRSVSRLPELLELAERLELPQLITPAFIPERSPRFAELSPRAMTEAEWAEALPLLRRWGERARTESYVTFLEAFYRGRARRPPACGMGTDALVVDADGSVYPCFHRHDLCAGNLLCEPWPHIRQRLHELGALLHDAHCFGEHCLSLFAGAV